MMKYFRLTDKLEIEDAWYPSEVVDEQGKEVMASHFNHGKVFDSTKQLTVLLTIAANPVDFRLTSFGVPVVSSAFADVVESFDPWAIQRIPITIAPSIYGYGILNILTMLECIDPEHTNIEYYTKKDHVPEVIGQIKSIRNLTIRSDIAQGHHIFRLAERWTIIVVSEALKRALEENRLTGTKFIPIGKVYS